MARTMKGFGVGDIGPVALSMGAAIIMVAVVALVLVAMEPQTYESQLVFNQTFDNVTDLSLGYGLVSFTVYADELQTGDPLTADNYTYTSANGTLQVTDATAKGGGGLSLESVNYYRMGASVATGILAEGAVTISILADWFGIIIIVVVAVIILAMVMMLGGGGGRKGGRG